MVLTFCEEVQRPLAMFGLVVNDYGAGKEGLCDTGPVIPFKETSD